MSVAAAVVAVYAIASRILTLRGQRVIGGGALWGADEAPQ
jgi:hypothetical protein